MVNWPRRRRTYRTSHRSRAPIRSRFDGATELGAWGYLVTIDTSTSLILVTIETHAFSPTGKSPQPQKSHESRAIESHNKITTTTRASMLTLFLLLGVFVLSRSFVTLSSRHPSRATLTCRLGCLGGSVRCPFPSLFPGALNHQVLRALPVLLSAQHPSRATLACRLVASLGVLVVFLPAQWYM